MKVLEVNDNDIYGKIFNGYTIMEELNKTKQFSVNQLVKHKKTDNPRCKELISTERMIFQEEYLKKLEKEVLSTQSLLSATSLLLDNNQYYKECDLVHFHMVHNNGNSLPSFFEMIKKKPTVISFHDMWFMTGRCVQTYDCKEWMSGCKKCEYLNTTFDLPRDNCSELWKIKSRIKDTDVDVIVHSKYMYDIAKKHPYTKNLRIHEVPLGINTAIYDFSLSKEEAKRKLNIYPSDTVIMFRENEKLKGSHYAVEALKKLKDKSNITILTCDRVGSLEEIQNDFNIIEMGPIKEDDLLMCYNAADLFLVPSPGETFCMMAVEAMASGIPTIVFDNTAIPDTTGAPEVGILVNNFDVEDLCKKIEYYVKNKDEREKRGKASKEYVAEKFDYQKYIDTVKNIYEQAFEKQKYKLEKDNNESRDNIDFQNDNTKRLLNKLKKIYEEYVNIFENKHDWKLFKNEMLDGENIEYSNENCTALCEKFNEFMYNDFIENTQEKLQKDLSRDKKRVVKKMNSVDDEGEKMVKVSIIIPVYNGANYVSLAIDSALRQTYPNIEIIVVNDGSNDNTEEICKSYGDKIKYIKKENGGVSTALNLGIQEMTGDYFSWLSHDDLYYPEKVETEVNYLVKNNLVGTNTILYSDFSLMDGDGKLMYDAVLDTIDINRDSSFSILKGGIDGLTLLIPKKAFEEVGLFDENLRCLQDYKLWFEMYKKGYKFLHIPNVLAVTRIHASQVTNTNPRVEIEGNAFWLETIKYFRDEDKVRLYGSIYQFYYKLALFFECGPYKEAYEYCKEKFEEIEKKKCKKINETKVSILIPYSDNTEAVIRASNSVLNQTHKNIELIIVNNGCKEHSSEIQSLIDNNKGCVKYIEYNQKEKIAIVWDDFINKATGDYVVIFDQYSTMDVNRIEEQLTKTISSGFVISDTSYYDNQDGKTVLINSGYEDGDMSHKVINECYLKMPTVMIERKYLLDNEIIKSCIQYDYAEELCIFIKILANNRLLGICKPLTTIFQKSEEIDYKKKFKSIVNCVTTEKRFDQYPQEVNKLFKICLDVICGEKYVPEKDDATKKFHLDVLDRYAYMQTDECHEVEKIRNIINKILFRKKIPYYQLETEAIKNSGINKWYRKHKEKKERGK